MTGTPQRILSSVFLNASYSKKHEYVWIRNRDLYGFRDIKPIMKSMGWGMPRNATGTSFSVLLNASYDKE